jgi:hypothetical protein
LESYDYTIGYDYDVFFTIRHKSGFKYYSNPTTISFIIGQSTTNNVTTVEVTDLLVNVTYFDEIDLSKTTNKTSGNVNIKLPLLTANSINLSSNNSDDNTEITITSDYNIKQILVNSHDITNIATGTLYTSNWLTLRKDSSSDNNYTYAIAVTDNIPDIIYNDVTYSTDNVDDYMRLLEDTKDSSSLLFNMLTNNKKMLSTSDRSAKI